MAAGSEGYGAGIGVFSRIVTGGHETALQCRPMYVIIKSIMWIKI